MSYMNKERMNKERTSTFARRAFSVTGPLVVVEFAAGLYLRDPAVGRDNFSTSSKHLKKSMFALYWCIQRIRGFTTMSSINLRFTYLRAYFQVQYILQLWLSQTGRQLRRISSVVQPRINFARFQTIRKVKRCLCDSCRYRKNSNWKSNN